MNQVSDTTVYWNTLATLMYPIVDSGVTITTPCLPTRLGISRPSAGFGKYLLGRVEGIGIWGRNSEVPEWGPGQSLSRGSVGQPTEDEAFSLL